MNQSLAFGPGIFLCGLLQVRITLRGEISTSLCAGDGIHDITATTRPARLCVF